MDDDKLPNPSPGRVTGAVIRNQSIRVVDGSGQDSLPEGKRAWSFLFLFLFPRVLLRTLLYSPRPFALRSRL
jgi:hypothetical protein